MDRIARARPILDLIYRHESEPAVEGQGVASKYDVVWGGIRPEDRPKKLSAMSVGRVLWWQDLIDSRYQSEAAGAGQIMEDTLRDLVKAGVVKETDIFDAKTQDTLVLALLDRRGWARCEAGTLSPEAFGNALAKEWASLPVITGAKRGASYYAGDGLNKAHATPEEVLAAVNAALATDPIAARFAAIEAEGEAREAEIATLAARLDRIEAWGLTADAAIDRLENRHA